MDLRKAVVILQRSQRWFHGTEKWRVHWDDAEVVQLKADQFHVFTTTPGEHHIFYKCKDARSQTVRVALAPGDAVWFNLEQTKPAFETLLDSHLLVSQVLEDGISRLVPPSAESITPIMVEAKSPTPPPNARVDVELSPRLERWPSTSENINVARGATVLVRRSQTITRTIEVVRNRRVNVEGEVSLFDFIVGRVRQEAERRESGSTSQSETIECEVTLDSEVSQHWMLHWHDIWWPGRVTGTLGREAIDSDIRLLRHRELTVQPV